MGEQSKIGEFGSGGVFVFGGSGGLGAAIARSFAAAGCPVGISYFSDVTKGERVAAELEVMGVRTMLVQLKASDHEAVRDTLGKIAEAFGGLHSIIYAGGPPFQPAFFSTMSQAVWREWLDEDIFGCINLAQAAIPHLRASRGSFVTLSTYQCQKVEVCGAASSVSKAALDRMVKAVAKEEGRYGVRANSVQVGWIGVERPIAMLKEMPKFAVSKHNSIPLKRLGYPEEIGDVVRFLCSSSAGFITGVNLTVDGGESL
jgi:NAD(P)-dependent dehydrogenase (short-subunit alcohol dehydrogenase family)